MYYCSLCKHITHDTAFWCRTELSVTHRYIKIVLASAVAQLIQASRAHLSDSALFFFPPISMGDSTNGLFFATLTNDNDEGGSERRT